MICWLMKHAEEIMALIRHVTKYVMLYHLDLSLDTGASDIQD